MSEVQGIKLFGQTIVLQVKKEELPTTKNDEQKASINDQQQQLPSNKRPDKVIACPRCKSMETKFCYFNNYNVNQPRHFCKGCQRYWTAGGALRNVPVGAGRRRNKPPGRPESGGWLDDEMNMGMNGGVMMVDEWQLAAAMVAGFQMKRRRNESPTQTC